MHLKHMHLICFQAGTSFHKKYDFLGTLLVDKNQEMDARVSTILLYSFIIMIITLKVMMYVKRFFAIYIHIYCSSTYKLATYSKEFKHHTVLRRETVIKIKLLTAKRRNHT